MKLWPFFLAKQSHKCDKSRKEQTMRPRRYPYSGKRKSLERQPANSVGTKAGTIKLDSSSITFSGSKITINSQSITGVDGFI